MRVARTAFYPANRVPRDARGLMQLAVDCARGDALAEGDEQYVTFVEDVLFPFLEHEQQEAQGEEG